MLIPKPTTTQQQLHCSASGDSMSPVSAATSLYSLPRILRHESEVCTWSVRQEGHQKLHYDVLHSKVKAHEEHIVKTILKINKQNFRKSYFPRKQADFKKLNLFHFYNFKNN